jgi:DNA-binding NtrC family response regulator
MDLNPTCLEPPSAEPRAGSRPGTILVVDDEDPVRELIAYVLESHGYTIVRARHSREALFLDSCFAGTFDLLVTDICMHPHADGFALARALLLTRPGLRVIFSSGFVDPERLKREVEVSGALFLPKPFTPGGLLDCVRRSLAVPSMILGRSASPA